MQTALSKASSWLNSTIPGLQFPTGHSWFQLGDEVVIQAAFIGEYGAAGHINVEIRTWNVTVGASTSTTDYIGSTRNGAGQATANTYSWTWSVRPYA